MHGEGVFSWKDGREFRGTYIRDKKEGFGTFEWPDGRTYQGMWANGKQHGKGIYTNANGEMRYGVWANSKRIKWIDEEEYRAQEGEVTSGNLEAATQ